ncbi:Bud site selection protein, Revert to axial protein 1 [Kickxella alabastrina]|nr:Bud site selection protein, Revert to axial protein 1 [Kickxella alabastrina]
MSDKLQQKKEKLARSRQDSSLFFPVGRSGGYNNNSSGVEHTAHSEVSVEHEPTSEVLADGSAGTDEALDNAAALFASRRLNDGGAGVKAPLAGNDPTTVAGTISSMSSLPSHRFQTSVRDSTHNSMPASYRQQHQHQQQYAGSFRNPNMGDEGVDSDPLLIKTSLLDPHPIIIPPPGSRLAFAGADSREAVHRFRSLPSLEDTLLRRARAPLCLYNYWQYLLGIEACPEELEFWLSLADYEALYRKFARTEAEGLPPLISPQTTGMSQRLRYGRVESGALGHVVGIGGTGAQLATLAGVRGSRPVGGLDTEMQELDAYLDSLSYETTLAANDSRCQLHRQCSHPHQPFTQALGAEPHALDTPQRPTHHTGARGLLSRMFSGETTEEMGSSGVAGTQWTDGSSRHHPQQGIPLLTPSVEIKQTEDVPSVDDMRRAAERLYFHYLLPGSPSELYISTQMRDEVAGRIERDMRFDPALFAPVKRHVYDAMRNESYLRFLRERTMHNITRGTAAPRIVLGLALIFVALAAQLSLVFLDVKPKAWRWLPMAALWPGFTLAFAGVTRLDPLMAFLGFFEPIAWRYEHVRDPSIRDSHLKRASLQLIFTAIISVIITVVMFVVPGNHL